MSGLKDIGVKVSDGVRAANAHAVLREIESLLRKLVEKGESAVVDLKGLPMSAADFEVLADVLGQGEVTATLEAGGTSTARETAFPGVWWVTHRNDEGGVAAEFIEVARVPEIILSQPEDMALALNRLSSALNEPSPEA